MTQEEKAKAYDEALKRAKAAIDVAADKDLVKGVATTIFPQLRESKDEKIRKALIQEFKEKVQKSFEWKDGIPNNAVLAWLEKQKEQKPAESPNEGVIQKAYKEGVNDGIALVKKQPENYGLCKKPTWSEEDEKIRQSLLRDYEYAMQSSGTIWGEDFEKKHNWLKFLRPSWKPNEEQMEALLWCIAPLGGKYRSALKELHEQLKKLM